MTESKQTTLAEIKTGAGIQQLEAVPSFSSAQGMRLLEQAANMLTFSTIVPEQYRAVIKKNGSEVQNNSGFSNCIVALNMAQQMHLDPLTVMQNLHVIEGRPSWSAQFIIARINACSDFGRLRFDMGKKGEQVEIGYTVREWVDGKPNHVPKTAVLNHQTCRAYAKCSDTGDILYGPEVSIQMAIDEGWAGKNGSKWLTMQEVMLQYRAAAFWCRLNAPELLHGLPTDDELHDTIEADIRDGVMQAKEIKTKDQIRQPAKKQEPDQEPEATSDEKPEVVDAEDVELKEKEKEFIDHHEVLKRITSAESIDVLDVAEGFIQDCMPKTHDTLYARADKKRAELLAAKEESKPARRGRSLDIQAE